MDAVVLVLLDTGCILRGTAGRRWRGETGSHPRKAELVEMSGYKPGKLLRQVTHVWNGAKDMNGNYFSIVAKT